MGDTITIILQDQPVKATLLDIRRKQEPEPTDAMVEELQAKDLRNKPIHTVAEYYAFVKEQKTTEILATVNYYVMEKIIADHPIIEFDESDICALGELERAFFIKHFLEEEGMDLRENFPDSWKSEGIETLDDFIRSRREWYMIKIRQCLVFLNILDLPCEGKNDPLDHYEVLQELQLKIFDMIHNELDRRNA